MAGVVSKQVMSFEVERGPTYAVQVEGFAEYCPTIVRYSFDIDIWVILSPLVDGTPLDTGVRVVDFADSARVYVETEGEVRCEALGVLRNNDGA